MDNARIALIFACTYLGIALGHVPGLKLNRVGIVLLGAIFMMIFGGIKTAQAISFVNWPTVLLLFGFFVISAQLRLCGAYRKIADSISAQLDHPRKFLLILMLVAGGLSAFLNNDIICFVFTPVVGAALVRKKLNPIPFLVGLALASNIGAAATLVGNAQDMMIGQVAHLDFGRYMIWSAAPVIFALGCGFVIIWAMSSRNIRAANTDAVDPPEDAHEFNKPHAIKGLVILAAVIALLFTSVPKEIVALAAAGIHLASPKFRTEDMLQLVDWPILILFMALFVVTGAFQATGLGGVAVQSLAQHGLDINTPNMLVLVTAVLSNLINNSAAVMLMARVADLSHPVNGYILALANSFAGGLLVVGSVANIIVVQQARDMGITISFRDFARLGVPVTLAALAGLLGWVAIMK